jgi:hypothetical protein
MILYHGSYLSQYCFRSQSVIDKYLTYVSNEVL